MIGSGNGSGVGFGVMTYLNSSITKSDMKFGREAFYRQRSRLEHCLDNFFQALPVPVCVFVFTQISLELPVISVHGKVHTQVWNSQSLCVYLSLHRYLWNSQ